MTEEDWTTVKFGDVVENVRRNIKDREAAGIDRVLGLDDIETGNLHVTGWKDVDSSPSFRTHFKPTQTLFGKRRAYLRKVAYAEFEGVCTQNILVFETKDPEVLLPELLPFVCMSEPFMREAIKHSTGSLFPNANWRSIRDYEFRLPPLGIQQIISDILWNLDSTETRFAILDGILSQTIRIVRDSTLFSIEKDSGSTTMNNLCSSITKGQSPRWQGFEYTESGALFVTSENVGAGVLQLDEPKFLPEEFLEHLGRGVSDPGDLLITIVGNLGRACLAPELTRAGTNQAVAVLKPHSVEDSAYLLEVVLSSLTQRYFLRSGVATAQPNLTLKNIREIPVPNASEPMKKELVHTISDLRKAGDLVCNKLKTIRDLRRRLINEMENILTEK